MENGAAPGSLWRWTRLLLGPALFMGVELVFRPAPGEGIDPVLVRHALAATAWIAAWWFTEALPIAATSLLPLVLFPILGLGKPDVVSKAYGNEVIFLFLGGFLLAIAMENTGLHRRVALRIVGLFGTGRRKLVLGFMVATAAISMFISNTATAVMLLPVALAVLGARESADEATKSDQPFAVALLLGIAFAANIGGLGTPVGSPPNLLFQQIYHNLTGATVSFLGWMAYGVPVIVVLLPVAWWILVRHIPSETGESEFELPRLQPMSRAEWWVFGVFASAVLLWVTRADVGDLRGWGSRLQAVGVDSQDSTVAILAALVLFIVPRERRAAPILDWRVAPRLPWGVLLLMGAGFAISDSFKASGLTQWMGVQIQWVGHLPLPDSALFFAVLATVVLLGILVTEFASNAASVSILLPIVFVISSALGQERFPPQLLMVACTLACSMGFAVPAGTPPNALVFATERISIGRFIRIGLLVDLMAAIVILVVIAVHWLVR